jgi:RNA polymerase primary sigma factor
MKMGGDATDGVDSLGCFLGEIGRYALLTRAEEVELMKRVERGDREARERIVNAIFGLSSRSPSATRAEGCPCSI